MNGPHARDLHRRWWCLLAILAFVGLWNLPTLWYPYGQDQALAHLIGQMILDGKVPYRDVIDDKPPGVFYLYALLIHLAGEGMAPVRAADILALFFTMTMMWLLGRRLQGSAAGLLGALLFGLSYPLTGFWNTALQEGFLLPFLWGSLLCAVRAWERDRAGDAILCGAALGAVFWFKYPYALPLVWLWAALIWRSWGRKRSGILRHPSGLGLSMGFMAILCAGVLLLWQAGALDGLLDITVAKNIGERVRGPAKIPVGTEIMGPWQWITEVPLLMAVMVLALVGYAGICRRMLPGCWVVLGYGMTMLVAIYIQRRFFQYHWIPFLSFVCFGAGLGLRRLGLGLERTVVIRAAWLRRSGAVLGLALLVVLGLVDHRQRIRDWGMLISGRLPWEGYLVGFPGLQGFSPYVLEDWMVARVLMEGDPDKETLFVWGSRPLVYYFSGLEPATSFLYINHLFMPGLRGQTMRVRIEGEFLARLPDALVVSLREGWTEALEEMATMVPRVHDALMSEFFLSEKMGQFLVFERTRRGGKGGRHGE